MERGSEWSVPGLVGTRARARARRSALVAALGGLLWLAAGSVSARASAGPVELWVAPDGDDAAEGDRDHPLHSLTAARDAARAVPRGAHRDVVIHVRGGTYRLAETLVLDASDSGRGGRDVIWAAEPGEHPVVSGAIAVGGWALHDAERGIYRAFAGTQRTRQLYVDGRRATRAQTAPYPQGYERTSDGFRWVGDGPPPAWSRPADLEAMTVAQWKIMRCPVAAIDGASLVMQQPCWANANLFLSAKGAAPLWSFEVVYRLENAYELLDEPGEWYHDAASGWLYYRPLPGEDLTRADVEMPVLETLIDGRGTEEAPLSHVRFSGLEFAYATWLAPSGPDGYAADQSGFHVTGTGHEPTLIGHVQRVARTPGNVRFHHAVGVRIERCTFAHLGGVALDFDTGSQRDSIVGNHFVDVSSAAIQLGGVDARDHHPTSPAQVSRDNEIANNLVEQVGEEYWDAAGIYVGFTTRSLVRNNDIRDVPWSGIAIGWGWGLVDPGEFLGAPGAVPGEWQPVYTTPTTSRGNRILNNRIRRFLMKLWDGGAIYTLGQQGLSMLDGERIAGNVASEKRREAGGNTFYTDGGSRYVTLSGNVSFDDPVGTVDFGPCDVPNALALCALTGTLAYGADAGGCRPYGDLLFDGNYLAVPEPPFFDICPYGDTPVRRREVRTHAISSEADVPEAVLRAAGREPGYRDPE